MPYGGILQFDPQVVRAFQACRNVSTQSGGDVKLGRSPGWNLARAERSRLYIYAFVEKKLRDQEVEGQINPTANTCDLEIKGLRSISSVRQADEYMRSPTKMELDLAPGESRGY